jgi:hypothetical protein
LAGALYCLEEHLNAILMEYSKETNVAHKPNIDEREKNSYKKPSKKLRIKSPFDVAKSAKKNSFKSI